MRNCLKNEKGQGLLEVVIALGVMIIIATALVGVVAKSIDNSTFSRNKAKASSLAQKSMEEARDLRDQDQTAFFTNTDSVCDLTPPTVDGIFTIERECDLESEDVVNLGITASWTDNKGKHETKINTQFNSLI